jgi:osmotically-inducible protein OsmY
VELLVFLTSHRFALHHFGASQDNQECLMQNDSEIQKEVTSTFKAEPSLRDDDMAVGVRDGIVTLAGFVDSYADKWRAERMASQVKGVRAVVNDIQVRLPSASQRPDPEQKEEAEHSVRNLTGVKGVSNLITLAAKPTPTDVKKRLVEALQRGAQLDAERITVEIDGHKAILRGTVRSYAELKDADRAVRHVPGISEVENHLTVDPNIYMPV